LQKGMIVGMLTSHDGVSFKTFARHT
jgi:hypothetical protein